MFQLKSMGDFSWLAQVSGKDRTLTGVWALLFHGSTVFMAGWYMYTSGFGIVSTETNRAFYLLFTSILVFLIYPASRWAPRDRPSWWDLLCIVLVTVSLGYWVDQYVPYAIFRVSSPNTWDLTMGMIAIVMIVETSRRVLGPAMVILVAVFLAQLYFGPWLPGRLSHGGMSIERIIEFTYSTQEALFGVITTTFATFVFPFMVFGAFLERSGAGTFFMELAISLTGRWRGGPAKIATVTSALFGSISGSSVANVVSTGTFTIPMMKRTGFKPEVAGAIEAIASTGGQFMPPIMGAGVFILATLIEVEYLHIALLNVIPALLYFAFVLFMVDLEALRNGLRGLPSEEIPSAWAVVRKGWHFFLPLAVVLGLLFWGYSPEVGAFWGTLSAFVLSLGRAETRMRPGEVLKALSGGAQANTSAGAAIGSLGVIIGGLVLSGLGLKFSAVLVESAGGHLFIAVLMVMVISIIIGMGSSTTGSYIILSVVAAPALIHLGVPVIAAHLFVFYAACLSNVTPPVCVSAFAGAAIAGADPMKTGFTALKYGAALVLLPLGFVYVPGLLLEGTPLSIVDSVAGTAFGLMAIAMAIQGADFVHPTMHRLRRAGFALAGLLLLFPTNLWVDLAGYVVLIVAWLPAATRLLGRRPATESAGN